MASTRLRMASTHFPVPVIRGHRALSPSDVPRAHRCTHTHTHTYTYTDLLLPSPTRHSPRKFNNHFFLHVLYIMVSKKSTVLILLLALVAASNALDRSHLRAKVSDLRAEVGGDHRLKPGMVIALKGGKDNKFCADEGGTLTKSVAGGGSACASSGCLWDASRCTKKFGQCGILETEAEAVCLAWSECGGVVCKPGYRGYCLARRTIDAARVTNGMYAYTKKAGTGAIKCNRDAVLMKEYMGAASLSPPNPRFAVTRAREYISATGSLEKFKVVDVGGGNIALRSDRHGVHHMAVELLGSGKLALKKNNKYCADEGGKGVKCNRSRLGTWEKFKIYSYVERNVQQTYIRNRLVGMWEHGVLQSSPCRLC